MTFSRSAYLGFVMRRAFAAPLYILGSLAIRLATAIETKGV